MKKFFTLISVALFAMSAFAQDPEPKQDPQGHYEGIYPAKNVVWNAIRWYNGNNKKDKDNKDLLYLMGDGNGYASLLAKYSYSEDKGEWQTTADYTYIDYENGETGTPAYGLYYQFTPKTSGSLRVSVWVNKGGDNRKVFVVKASDGKPLTPFVDYTFDGYINGKNQEGVPIYYNTTDFKAWRDEQFGGDGVKPYRLSTTGAAVWGWITLDVVAGESYIIYQQSSQLGFGGYEFGSDQYVSCLDMGGTIAINAEFANVVDESGNVKAAYLSDEGSVVNFGTANVDVKAVGGAVPASVEADFDATGITSITKNEENVNAPVYNLAGQRVSAETKGLLIKNGKKFMNK